MSNTQTSETSDVSREIQPRLCKSDTLSFVSVCILNLNLGLIFL